MTKQHIEFVLSGYGVPFTDALADKLLEMFDEEAASYQHTINELNKALSENKGEWIAYDHGMGLVYLKCPFCGMTIDKRHVEHNFCGKCGAKLSGEKSGFERIRNDSSRID